MKGTVRRSWLFGAALCVVALILLLGAVGCGGEETTTSAATAEPLVIGAAMGMIGDAAAGDVPVSLALQYSVELLRVFTELQRPDECARAWVHYERGFLELEPDSA